MSKAKKSYIGVLRVYDKIMIVNFIMKSIGCCSWTGIEWVAHEFSRVSSSIPANHAHFGSKSCWSVTPQNKIITLLGYENCHFANFLLLKQYDLQDIFTLLNHWFFCIPYAFLQLLQVLSSIRVKIPSVYNFPLPLSNEM